MTTTTTTTVVTLDPIVATPGTELYAQPEYNRDPTDAEMAEWEAARNGEPYDYDESDGLINGESPEDIDGRLADEENDRYHAASLLVAKRVRPATLVELVAQAHTLVDSQETFDAFCLLNAEALYAKSDRYIAASYIAWCFFIRVNQVKLVGASFTVTLRKCTGWSIPAFLTQ